MSHQLPLGSVSGWSNPARGGAWDPGTDRNDHSRPLAERADLQSRLLSAVLETEPLTVARLAAAIVSGGHPLATRTRPGVGGPAEADGNEVASPVGRPRLIHDLGGPAQPPLPGHLRLFVLGHTGERLADVPRGEVAGGP